MKIVNITFPTYFRCVMLLKNGITVVIYYTFAFHVYFYKKTFHRLDENFRRQFNSTIIRVSFARVTPKKTAEDISKQ